jgi:UDP-N-acetylmuramate--alanine ligase
MHVHFIGIGGIGVSALARYFLAQNWTVSGSDLSSSDLTSELSAEGVQIYIGHDVSHVPHDTSLVIHTSAIPPENPELTHAISQNIKVQTYPQALGSLTAQFWTIAISGSHGKSTSTALLALIMEKAGLDPTVIVGTKLKEFGGSNFRNGKSKYLLIEADEYKGAFWNYTADLAMVTNVDREHLDFYKDIDDVQKSFKRFLQNMRSGGCAVLNHMDPHLPSIASNIDMQKVWYGPNEDPILTKAVREALYLPGDHNLSNALGVYSVAKQLNIPDDIIFSVFREFKSSWRRMEYKGLLRDTEHLVFDDYGHHPTEISATLKAAREKHPDHMVVCVFQPHHGKRLQSLFDDFVIAFDNADVLILLDTYVVQGRDVATDTILSLAEKLHDSVAKRREGPKVVEYMRNSETLHDDLRRTLIRSIGMVSESKNAVILMMGAGDVVNITPHLLQ